MAAEAASTAFILGAGFTRAFFPGAPLLTDEYDLAPLITKYREFPTIRRLLDLELQAPPKGKINIERLLTRLTVGMPYDAEAGVTTELRLLFDDVQRMLIDRLMNAVTYDEAPSGLVGFASYCVGNRATCVTFNYDDALDSALWAVKKATLVQEEPYWHPDGGYGFFCRPSEWCIRDLATPITMDTTAMLLLKLHGSLNWRLRRGYPSPYSTDAVVHDAAWLEKEEEITPDERAALSRHLEPKRFIIPPILTKGALDTEPVLRIVWSLAYEALSKADRVVFIGYSFPGTDMGSRFLFKEALDRRPRPRVTVVNLAESTEAKEAIRLVYREALPFIPNKRFAFGGAARWIERHIVNADPW